MVMLQESCHTKMLMCILLRAQLTESNELMLRSELLPPSHKFWQAVLACENILYCETEGVLI